MGAGRRSVDGLLESGPMILLKSQEPAGRKKYLTECCGDTWPMSSRGRLSVSIIMKFFNCWEASGISICLGKGMDRISNDSILVL